LPVFYRIQTKTQTHPQANLIHTYRSVGNAAPRRDARLWPRLGNPPPDPGTGSPSAGGGKKTKPQNPPKLTEKPHVPTQKPPESSLAPEARPPASPNRSPRRLRKPFSLLGFFLIFFFFRWFCRWVSVFFGCEISSPAALCSSPQGPVEPRKVLHRDPALPTPAAPLGPGLRAAFSLFFGGFVAFFFFPLPRIS